MGSECSVSVTGSVQKRKEVILVLQASTHFSTLASTSAEGYLELCLILRITAAL
jgi:hypothetical protein